MAARDFCFSGFGRKWPQSGFSPASWVPVVVFFDSFGLPWPPLGPLWAPSWTLLRSQWPSLCLLRDRSGRPPGRFCAPNGRLFGCSGIAVVSADSVGLPGDGLGRPRTPLGLSWAASRCLWLPLAASGRLWLLLVAAPVGPLLSRSRCIVCIHNIILDYTISYYIIAYYTLIYFFASSSDGFAVVDCLASSSDEFMYQILFHRSSVFHVCVVSSRPRAGELG